MSRLQSIRLAQFWRLRLKPLIDHRQVDGPLAAEEIFESIGWLAQGVFCGFFDSHEADVAWIRLRPLIEVGGVPTSPVVSESWVSEIVALQRSSEPFRRSLQMVDGSQKEFELPLFSHALLLSNRFFSDPLARACTSIIVGSESRWKACNSIWNSVDASRVLDRLAEADGHAVDPISSFISHLETLAHILASLGSGNPTRERAQADPGIVSTDVNSVAAGYMRLLEHMEASRSFFGYAKAHTPRRSDFESYCLRIGGLNGWRIPLSASEGARRFKELSNLLEFAVRPAMRKALPDMDWSEYQDTYFRYLTLMVEAWENHHLSASLTTHYA